MRREGVWRRMQAILLHAKSLNTLIFIVKAFRRKAMRRRLALQKHFVRNAGNRFAIFASFC